MEQMENIITDVDNSQGLFFPTVIDNLVKDDAVNREVNRNDCLGKLGVGLGLHFPLPQEARFLIGYILYLVQVRRQADVDMAWRTYKILYRKINMDCTHESSLVWSLLCNILHSRWTILFLCRKMACIVL